MRASLLTRLLAGSILIAVLGIAATAWLAVRTTTGAIEQEQGRAIAEDATIYNTLLDYAATHKSWAGVGPTLTVLAQHSDRRIALLTHDRAPIADSGGGKLPNAASAVLDPLNVDPALVPDAPADRISPVAVGPFLLPESERSKLTVLARRAAECVRQDGGTATIATTPSGRPRLEGPDQGLVARCTSLGLDRPTTTESKALTRLNTLVNGCLARSEVPEVRLALDRSWSFRSAAAAPRQAVDYDGIVRTCLAGARHEQLAPYVAPSALLFVTSPTGAPPPSPFDLSAGNQTRIVLAAAAVLAVTVLISVLAGRRLTRPLRALTAAAERLRDGSQVEPVKVRGGDEIARLATAFNDMATARDRVERQRKDMVGDIAHELRTPLSNIRGWLEATEDGVSQADPALIASLLEEARLLQHIIDDLQDLAQADAGTLRLHPSTVDVTELLAQVRAVDPEAVRVRAAPLTITADPMRLRQLLGNLVSNALRHAGSAEIRAYRADGGVVFEVTDDGPGIAAADLPHVFDRFWRAEKSRSRATGGSGLGLAIVRNLAEAHGGSVTVESVPGQGATFRVRLPGRTS